VIGQAKQFSKEIVDGVKRSKNILKQLALEELHQQIGTSLRHRPNSKLSRWSVPAGSFYFAIAPSSAEIAIFAPESS
jgi:hypothetical protein